MTLPSETAELAMPLARLGRTAVERWLNGFDRGTVARVLAWLEADADQAWVVEPHVGLAEFRLQPAACLRLVQRTLAAVSAAQTPAPRVLWLLDNTDNRGLDDFEAEQVFGAWLVIDELVQVDPGKTNSRTLIAGRIREDAVGLAFTLPDVGWIGSWNSLASLKLLEWAGLPVAQLYLSHTHARRLLRPLANPSLVRQLRANIASGQVQLALLVPPERTEYALCDLAAEVAPLDRLAQREGHVRCVRFETRELLPSPERLVEILRNTHLALDSTLEGRREPVAGPGGEQRLQGPYFRGGAYQPQSFDFRSPAGAWDPTRALEIVRLPLSEFPGGLRSLWNWRCGINQQRLARVLNFARMERYFSSVEASVEWSRSYPEYRVYNWPRPEGSPRTTLIDCGAIDPVMHVWRTVRSILRLGSRLALRWRITPGAEFEECCISEARRRIPETHEKKLQDQVEAHGYLKTIPTEAPLRQDLENFVQFLPTGLGRALELGSGYGQLAQAVNPRAEGYVCVDLDRGMFRGLSAERRQAGVVADIHRLPFADGSFDSVLANNVLEHVYDPVACLREVRRVLRPGGRLFALIPLDALNASHQLATHLWKADEESIHRALASANMRSVRCETIDLYALGVRGAFPSCQGLVGKLEAARVEDVVVRSLARAA